MVNEEWDFNWLRVAKTSGSAGFKQGAVGRQNWASEFYFLVFLKEKLDKLKH